MTPFDVAVLIPTARTWNFESESALAIRKAIQAARFGVGLIVIENGIAGAKTGHETFPGYEMLRLPDGNKSAALNAGLALLSRETLIVFFDDDVIVPEGIIRSYAEEARRRGPGSYFGGPVDVRYEVPPARAVLPFLPSSAKGLSYGDAPRVGGDFFMGGNWAAFRSDLKAAGDFDPRFGPGSKSGSTGQETRAQRRLRERGARSVYIPECRISHLVPADRCSEAFVLRRAARNGTELAQTAREYRLWALLRVPLRLLRHGLGLAANILRPRDLPLAIGCRSAYWRAFVRGFAAPSKPS